MKPDMRLEDRAEITDAVHRWCRAIDRLDYDAMRTSFHEDAIDEHGPYNGGIDGLIAWIKDRHVGIPFSSHSVTNVIIDFVGRDIALVESYVRTLQRYPAENRNSLEKLCGSLDLPHGALDLMTSSRYIDRFECRTGTWKIAHRTLVPEWKQVLQVPDALLETSSSVLSKRSPGDHVYTELRRLRSLKLDAA